MFPSRSSEWRCTRDTPLAVIADPADPRVSFLRAALLRSRLPDPIVLPYLEVVRTPSVLWTSIPAGALVRIESPGRQYEIQQAILDRGFEPATVENLRAVAPGGLDPDDWRNGLIVNSRQWYLGFCAVLADIESALASKPDIRFTAVPADIRLLFDKRECHSHLQEAGLPVPLAIGSPHSYEELVRDMKERDSSRAFVKLRHGSAGSGVIAMETCRGKVQAWTTVETATDGGRIVLFNSRRIRCYRREEEVAALIDALCEHGLHVERWIPKAGIDGERFDLRVLAIAGEPAHVVARAGRSPITNLHLGNRRISGARIRSHVGEARWHDLVVTCRSAAALLNRSFQVSLDVAIGLCGYRHWILEMNAFGDLLRGCLVNGLDPYELQVETLFGASRGAPAIEGCPI